MSVSKNRKRTSNRRIGAPLPWSERVLSLVCAGFAVWTLCTQVVIFFQGSFFDLLWVSGGVLILLVGGAVVRPFLKPSVGGEREEGIVTAAGFEELSHKGDPLSEGGLRIGILFVAFIGVFWFHNTPRALWWVVGLSLSVGACLVLMRDPVSAARTVAKGDGWRLWLLSAMCAVYALVSHRPDADDSFYVNVAAAAKDQPGSPLFSADTLHGLSGQGPPLSVYKVHAWELWNGALSFLLDIQPLTAFHLISATAISILVPLAWAHLARQLTPRFWLATVSTVLLILMVVGDVHRWYGNFALVRIWQGKAVFLTVLLPLLWSWGLRFARRPGVATGVQLILLQIASIGMTSSALWAAPAATVTAILAGLSRRNVRMVSLGLAVICFYPLFLAAFLKDDLARVALRAGKKVGEPGSLVGEALVTVLGDGPLKTLSLLALAAAWTVAPAGLARRFATIVPLALWVTLLNPYAERYISMHLTGPSFWRSLWVLPVPLLLAFLMIAPVSLLQKRSIGRAATATPGIQLWIALLTIFLVTVPQIYGWSSDNSGYRLAFPDHKVPQEAALAALIRDHVTPGSWVVAPPQVNTWLPVLEDRPVPLIVRDYLRLGGTERRDRVGMVQVALGNGREPRSLAGFRRGLDRFNIEAVLFYNRSGGGEPRLRQTLRVSGFEVQERRAAWELWIRRRPDPVGDLKPEEPLPFPFLER